MADMANLLIDIALFLSDRLRSSALGIAAIILVQALAQALS
jgi:hypothetical protein